MKKSIGLFLIAIALSALSACNEKTDAENDAFVVETMSSYTPVKDQGKSTLCWVYAMLATIESDRIAIGDSVNLSPDYVARMLLRESVERSYLSQGNDSVSLRAMAPFALHLLQRNGVMPYDSYHSSCNYDVLCRRMSRLAEDAARRKTGIENLLKTADGIMDSAINPMPYHVYMLGAEYTPVSFAHSLVMPGDYIALTSFTHKPFYEPMTLDVPDNVSAEMFMNVPIDTLVNCMERALRKGHGVCWEGDISESGFSFDKGMAVLDDDEKDLSQTARQREFETFRTTDNHCMELVGIAHDGKGRKYFVCKNSWGTDNPYGGLMYMSFDYARMKTIAVVLKND
ncbi:MAG: C1 family peptidase [Prevotellaceae bacterium]|nr:C1 family peptidase [Prevotellaceae bacterium]